MKTTHLIHWGQSRYIMLPLWLVLLLPWQNLPAQDDYVVMTDTQKISLTVNDIYVNIQRWKPGELRGFGWGDVNVDGAVMTSAALHDSVRQLVTAAAGRGGILPYRGLENWLGPFGDFEIIDVVMAINSWQCHVDCTYLLTARGEKKAPGVIQLEKLQSKWRITTINGLLPFLSAEVQSLGRAKAQQLNPLPSKKKMRP